MWRRKKTTCWRDFVDHWICRYERLDTFFCCSIEPNGHNRWKIISTHIVYSSISTSKVLKKRKKFPVKDLPQWLTLSNHSISSVQFSCSVMSDSLRPHEPQHARRPCPSPAPGVYPNSYPLSLGYHPTISSSVIPFSSCLQSFAASGSLQMSQFFTSSGQRIRVSASASVLPMNIQDWFPLGWTGWISLQSKGLSRVFSNITVQKHQFLGTPLSL